MADVKTDWALDTNVLQVLDNVLDKGKRVDTVLDKIQNSDPFTSMAGDTDKASQKLGELIGKYDKLINHFRGLKPEKAQLVKIQNELIAKEKEFLKTAKYDEYIRQLKQIKERIKEINEQKKQASNRAKDLGNSFKFMGISLNRAFQVTGILFLINKLVDLGKKIIDVTGLTQNFTNQFTRQFDGNRKAAEAYVNEIQGLADRTNLLFDQVAEGAAKLGSRGIRPTIDELTRLGDVSNFIQKDFDQLYEAILDINNSERWRELGFAVETVGNKVKLAYGDKFKVETDRTVEGIYKSILALSKLKEVQGSTAEAGKTLNGRMSTLTDTFTGFFRKIGDNNTIVLSRIIDYLTKFLQVATEVVDVIDPAITLLTASFGTLFTAVGDLINHFGQFNSKANETATVGQKIGFVFTKFVAVPLTAIVLTISGVIEGFTLLFQYMQLAKAKLTGNEGLAAQINKEMEETKNNLAEIRAQGKANFDQLLQDFDDYIKEDNARREQEKKRRKQQQAELEAVLNNTKPPKPVEESDADKKKREKQEADFLNALLEAKKNYEEEIKRLETENRKELLEQFDKDSISYLNAKKKADLELIQAEQDKLLELKRLREGTAFYNDKTKKTEIRPNQNTTLNASDLELFNARRRVIEQNYDKDLIKLMGDKSLEELELLRDSNEKEFEIERLKWQNKIDIAKRGTTLYELLIQARNRSLEKLTLNQSLNALDSREEDRNIDVFNYYSDLRQAGLIKLKDFEAQIEEERLKTALIFAQRRLALLEAFGDKENKQVQKQIKQLKGAINEIQNTQKTIEENKTQNTGFVDLLLGNESDNEDIENKVNFLRDQLSGFFDFETELTQARVDKYDKLIEAKKQEIDKEAELNKQGLANNYALRQQELAQLQKDREQALKANRAYQTSQNVIESLNQSTSLVSAAANIFKFSTATTGPLGVGIAAASIAALLFFFKQFKQRAISEAQNIGSEVELEEGGLIKGPSHRQGGMRIEGTNIFVEGDEHVTNKRQTKKHLKLLEAINSGRIDSMPAMDILKLANPSFIGLLGKDFDAYTGVNANQFPPELMEKMLDFFDLAGGYYNEAPRTSFAPLGNGIIVERGKGFERLIHYPNPLQS